MHIILDFATYGFAINTAEPDAHLSVCRLGHRNFNKYIDRSTRAADCACATAYININLYLFADESDSDVVRRNGQYLSISNQSK